MACPTLPIPIVESADGMLDGVQGYPMGFIPTGRIFWLDNADSAAADKQENGTFDAPFATLDYAASRCQSGRGDTIFVNGTHSETFAASISIDSDAVAVIGIPFNNQRPTFIAEATASERRLIISGENVLLFNILLVCQHDTQRDEPILDITGAGALIHSCVVRGDDIGSNDYATALVEIATPDVRFENCLIFHNQVGDNHIGTAPATGIYISHTSAHRVQIVDNVVATNVDESSTVVHPVIGYFGSADLTDVLISGNRIIADMNATQSTSGSDACLVDLSLDTGDALGAFVRNVGYYDLAAESIDDHIALGAAAKAVCQNFVVNVPGEAGGIAPETVST